MASRRPTDSPGKSSPAPSPKSPPPSAASRKTPPSKALSPKVPTAAEKTPASPVAAAPRVRKRSVKTDAPGVQISEDMRRGMIAQVAYLRAERRGFCGGSETEDWLAAEAEVGALLSVGHGRTAQ